MTDLVSIRSDRLSAEINPLGAELWSLRDEAGRDLLWGGDPAVWASRAPVLFPVIGCVSQGVIQLDGKSYPMPKHGVARPRTFTVVEQSDSVVTFRLEDDAGTREAYPFAFRLDIRFAIEGDALTMAATVSNPSAGPLPASFGFHPALRWPLPWGGDRAAHCITFDEAEPAPIRRIDSESLVKPEKETTPVVGREIVLRDELFVPDVMIFDAKRSYGLSYGVPGQRQLRVDFPEIPDLGIWTKPGAGYVCIEPWCGTPDPVGFEGDFRAKPGVVEIPAGASRTFTMRISTGA